MYILLWRDINDTRIKMHFHELLKPIVWATKRITWRLLSELYSHNFYTWKSRRVEATELKVEATELRDKFRVYKLLIFQYYFSKVIVRLLYRADVFLSRFGVASTYNFLKELIVHRITSPHILSTYYGTFRKFRSRLFNYFLNFYCVF